MHSQTELAPRFGHEKTAVLSHWRFSVEVWPWQVSLESCIFSRKGAWSGQNLHFKAATFSYVHSMIFIAPKPDISVCILSV